MLSRLRENFGYNSEVKFEGVVQAGESFVRGKNKNRHKSKRIAEAQGRSVKDKAPVFEMVNDVKVYTNVISDAKATRLKPIIEEMVEKGAIVVTDEWHGYTGLLKDYDHNTVDQSGDKFKTESGLQNNSIEGFWSHLKRDLYGIYHKASAKHLGKYCNEFSYILCKKGF